MPMQPWLVPPGQQKPGLGQQLASSAANKIATDQVAKLGLQAAGTAAAGPLGGAVGSAAGELAGPLAGQLVGSLFNKGGAVYAWTGQDIQTINDQARMLREGLAHGEHRDRFTPENAGSIADRYRALAALYNQQKANAPSKQAAAEVEKELAKLKPVVEEEVVIPEVISPRAKARATWDIPLGEALGAEWSTQGHYADMDTGQDPWGAMLKGTWRFEEGGEVPKEKKSIWGKVADKISSDFTKRKSLLGKGKTQPQYKAIGGMTAGPLGMSDALAAGKDKDISKVKIKKNKGDMSEEVEFNYHAPLAPKPTGE